jgi:anhydro-N-acetylmuramic acid kinase
MIVAGVMSGTSADGIDVAIVRLTGRGFRTRFELLSRYEKPYPANVRRAVLASMDADAAKVADLARLNFLLGELYADAISAATKSARLKLALIGCHGQTLYHQGDARRYLGRDVACTWQTGEGSIIAARTGVPVVTDFRPADMAAGGLGAPLVPFLDYLLYRHTSRGRIVLNIGGIANFSAIPAGAGPEQVIAFDTGPGNMVIDAVVKELLGKAFDRDGRVAARGKPIEPVLERLLRGAFFHRNPPKTAGREEFGREYVANFLKMCRGARKEDVVATATALTSRSIAGAVRMCMVPLGRVVRQFFAELIASGGGSKNRTLMKLFGEQVPDLTIKTTDDFGLPSESKEAVAFAVLAYQTWHRLPGNLPAATGAERAVVLGKISYP